MYVDESGDTGRLAGSTRHFCLSGIVLHESNWQQFLDRLLALRRFFRDNYGLPLRAEIHSSEYLQRGVYGLEKHVRLAILRHVLDELAKMPFISVTNVLVDKQHKPASYDVLQAAWGTLFQRFENTLRYGNFPGGYRQDHGMVITDAVAGNKLTRLVRKMCVYNPIPNAANHGVGTRNIPIVKIIEDPAGRDSREPLPVQMCDVVAYFLMQRSAPNRYIRRKRAQNYFERLAPCLNTYASRADALGIVRL